MPMPMRPSLLRLVALLSLTAPGRSPAQPVAVTLGPAEPVPALLHTFNVNLMTATAFQGLGHDGPQFEDGVGDLHPQGLRFPGGTIANHYLWRTDSFSEPAADRTGWAGEHVRLFRRIGRPYDLPGFLRVCRRHGTAVVWVLNVHEETPAGAVALVDHLKEQGLRVAGVELGNEPYWDGRSLADVGKYMAFCRPLAAALRQAHPDVKLGACFAPLGNPANYEEIWNAPLAREDWWDAVVFHEYFGGQGLAPEAGAEMPAAAMLHPEAWLETPIAAYAELAPGKPLWLTEWNVGAEGLKRWRNTGAEMLFAAAGFATLVGRRDTVELATFHDFFGDGFGLFHLDDRTGAVATDAPYRLFALLGAALDGAGALRPADFGADDLFGFAVDHDSGPCLFVVHRGGAGRALTLPAEFASSLVRTIACPPEQALPTSVPLATTASLAGAVAELPAYSISLVAPAAVLERRPGATADANLFPRRPHLTLWHEPFALPQPRFDLEGVYAIDTTAFRDKPVAVVKMALAPLGLAAGTTVRLDFAVRSTAGGALVVKLPQPAAAGDAAFLPLTAGFVRHRLRFAYDPAAGDGDVTFVLPAETLAPGGAISFRDFAIAPD